MSAGSIPALFLDRDGVINCDKGYVGRIEDFEYLPGIFELARFAASELAWPVVVVSNQSGIGRGYFDEAAYCALTDWMCERFRAERAPLARVYHCPYHPTEGIGAYRADHPWRKPKPGMILQAAADLSLDLSRSALVGDKIEDMEAAAAAGVPLRIRIDAGAERPLVGSPPHHVVRNLAEALSVLGANAPLRIQESATHSAGSLSPQGRGRG
jgi:D-glycero-D-manno-heptose 1,7-bisphosphate phosphatase